MKKPKAHRLLPVLLTCALFATLPGCRLISKVLPFVLVDQAAPTKVEPERDGNCVAVQENAPQQEISPAPAIAAAAGGCR